jgi:hypothetical protein
LDSIRAGSDRDSGDPAPDEPGAEVGIADSDREE